MAKQIELPKDFTPRDSQTGGGLKYPWDDWFNNQPWIIERSDGPESEVGSVIEGRETVRRDYNVPIEGMPPKLKTAARRRYKVFTVLQRTDPAHKDGRKLPNGGYCIQTRDMTVAERKEEDALREEEKKELKKKLLAKRNASKPVTQVVPPVPAPAPHQQTTVPTPAVVPTIPTPPVPPVPTPHQPQTTGGGKKKS